ncbi:MAG: hypothetical protein H7Y18_11880 [Clostridiaceae bacterium]|nr:hypothetical protein [Clostridiaceae bacterium]
MGTIVGTEKLNKRLKYSSSVTKSATLMLKGRSAFIFKKSTDYYLNP